MRGHFCVFSTVAHRRLQVRTVRSSRTTKAMKPSISSTDLKGRSGVISFQLKVQGSTWGMLAWAHGCVVRACMAPRHWETKLVGQA